MQNLKHIIFGTFLGLTLFIPTLVLAQATTTAPTSGVSGATEYKGVDASIASYLCVPSDSVTDNSQDLPNCINKVYRFSIAFGAIALVFFVVYAGYLYMIGGETGKASAKTMIQNAIIGILLLLGSYVILTFINPNLVIYKPIQAPLFTANDFPSCEEIGFVSECIISGGEDSTQRVGAVVTGGYAAVCTEGLSQVSSFGVPTKDGKNLEICKSLGPKLKKAYEISKGEKWRVTATIDPGHSSRCHKPGFPENGNCADIGTGDGDRTIARWEKICASIIKQGGVAIANEISPKSTNNLSSFNTPSCGAAKDKSLPAYKNASDAPSIHVNYTGK